MDLQTRLITLSLSEQDCEQIESIIERLQAQYTSTESDEFATACYLMAQSMPYHLRKQLNDFRNQRVPGGYLVVKGFSIDDEQIGATPSHWDAPWERPKTLREEIYHCLISSCLGDIFGWLTQENGRFIRHIVPIEKDKNEQLGGSSNVTLLWHIEEAFHPHRADMMTIMCYRNEEQATTNICSLNDLDIPEHYRKVLSEPRYIIEPDKSHTMENNNSSQWSLDEGHFNKIRSFIENPTPVAVLGGKPGYEHLLIDEAFMEAVEGDTEAKEALEWLFNHMNERKTPVITNPGDVLVIDNRITVHGRAPYKPNYGPKARWLRRINITTDLVKSHEWKTIPYGRVIL